MVEFSKIANMIGSAVGQAMQYLANRLKGLKNLFRKKGQTSLPPVEPVKAVETRLDVISARLRRLVFVSGTMLLMAVIVVVYTFGSYYTYVIGAASLLSPLIGLLTNEKGMQVCAWILVATSLVMPSCIVNQVNRRSDDQLPDVRIQIGERQKASNQLHTHHYPLLLFLPYFLLNQFKQFANSVFLGLVLIRYIVPNPAFGNEMFAPLAFILFCTLIREIFEDLVRRYRDRKVNHQRVWAHTDNGWEHVYWCSLHVGQLVQIRSGEQLPADVLVLSTSEPGDCAYVDTANLDGESSLKIRQAIADLNYLNEPEQLEKFWTSKATICCSAPNKDLHTCDGYVEVTERLLTEAASIRKSKSIRARPVSTSTRAVVKSMSRDTRLIEFSINNLLLRGSRLENTKQVYGIVIYTGKDTKLSKNNTKRTPKLSTLSSVVNWVMVTEFGLLVLLCAATAFLTRCYPAIGFLEFTFHNNSDLETLSIQFLQSLIMFSGFVPISLYVTVEVVEVIQGIFIHLDKELQNEKGKGVEMKMFSLNSDLGKIKYVMSDKTGTLTENSMHLRMCSVGGLKYANKKTRRSEKFAPRKLLVHMLPDNKHGVHNKQAREFVLACAVCHTVTSELGEHVADSHRPVYHATSPDELALINFAADANFVFLSRSPKKFVASIMGRIVEYEMLCLMEFNSDRKRMSVIVRDADNKIRLFCKGADHIVFARLKTTPQRLLKKTNAHLKYFAVSGYRTLCFAGRWLTESELADFQHNYQLALKKTNRKEELDKLFDDIETELELYGVSAIEDKLQEAVPLTIKKMLQAGIRVWVLTGDKLETAINIGNSCRLLDVRAPMMVLNNSNRAITADQIADYITKMGDHLRSRNQQISLIVDGSTLDFILESEDLSLNFLQLALCCSAVICCRCTPLQKASVTCLVRNNVSGSVLAVGDGANDVSMLQEAQVGVAIAGKEGMQAALAADYVISQFKHLERLLLVHGTLSVFRTSKTIMYCLYKNIFETVMMCSFMWYNGRSSQIMADQWTSICYNAFFTSCCSLSLGVADRPATTEFLLKYPKLYRAYQNTINVPVQMMWTVSGVIHGLVVFHFTRAAFSESVVSNDGKDLSLYVFGCLIYFSAVSVANLKAVLETNSITLITFMSLLFAPIFFVAVLLAQSYFIAATANVIFLIPYLHASLLVFVTVFTALGNDLAFHALHGSFEYNTRHQVLFKEGVRGPNFDVLYEPIYKICDVMGIQMSLESGRRSFFLLFLAGVDGFAFAQDDGRAVTQQQILECYEAQSPAVNMVSEFQKSDDTVESSSHSMDSTAKSTPSVDSTIGPTRSAQEEKKKQISGDASPTKL